MKKLICIVLIVIFCVSSGSFAYAENFEFESESVVLIEPTTGKVLYEHNPHEALPIASVTKVMTLLLAMESLEEGETSLDDEIVVSQRAEDMGGTQIFLEKGQKISFEQALIAVAVGSANDAAVAVAEHIATSVEAFVEQMNYRAQELGMKNTEFFNPSGLPINDEKENLSSAYDVAVMSKELLKYSKIHQWSTIEWDTEFLGDVYLSNTNLKFLRNYPGADGIKTGWTTKAGYCISATAAREETRFLAVILNSPSPDTRLEETNKLLNHGFAQYKTVFLYKAGESLATLEVEKGSITEVDILAKEDISILLDKNDDGELTTNLSVPKRLEPPMKQGKR